MQRRHIKPFNPKATIAILKEDPKVGDELNESQKRVLVDRYLEVSSFISLKLYCHHFSTHLIFLKQHSIKRSFSFHSLSN